MLKAEGSRYIQKLRQKWVLLQLLQIVFTCLALALFIGSIGSYAWQFSSWLTLPLFIVFTSIYHSIKPIWKISSTDIAKGLNRKFAVLEESATMFLDPDDNTSQLQILQMERIAGHLFQVEIISRWLKTTSFFLIILTAALGCFFLVNYLPPLKWNNATDYLESPQPKVKEVIPITISDFSLTIISPSYTHLPNITQKQFFLTAATGSFVKWAIETSGAIKDVKLVFNAKEIIRLKSTDDGHRKWVLNKVVHQSGFYQLEIDGKKSDFYEVTIIADLPVIIKINEPKQHTTIDIGQLQKVNLDISFTDDYEVKAGFLSATMASGKGEGVSFTERKINLEASFGNTKAIQVKQVIDLKSLGMKPGDELYFFVNATDNHGQSSRSDIYFVSIVDTTELMSLSGMTNGVNLVPEYFRSQRQIIIDTEKLLKDQSTIAVDAFRARSNELGVDQKLLRLRYGQFLGEENETEIGVEHDDDHHDSPAEETKFGDAQSIIDKYAHKHDVAEDPTFFEPEVKAKLKAVLTEMWNSELKLRTYQPKAALPYEYKALRLLKDLQQQTRAYVAKTTFKVATLKPEKRLSGELGDIMQPVQRMDAEQKEQRTNVLKAVLSILERNKTRKKITGQNKLLLNETEKYMIGSAVNQPSNFLTALTNIRKLSLGSKISVADIELIQQAITRMIKTDFVKPEQLQTKPSSTLYDGYFKYLTKGAR